VDFDVLLDQLLIRYSVSDTGEAVGVFCDGTLVILKFEKISDSVMREELHNIIAEFGISMNLVWLIKMYLNETYSKVHKRKNLFHEIHIQNGLKQEMLYRHCFSILL